MKPYTFTKQPAEERKLEFDATKSLATTDTIGTISAKIFDSDGTDVSAIMISGLPILSSDSLKVYVKIVGGIDGETYWLRIRITTTAGELIEDDLKIFVKQTGK